MAAMDRYEAGSGEPLPYYRGHLLGVVGRRAEALELAREVEARIERGEASWDELAMIYASVGDREHALDAIERLDRARISFMPYHTPVWRPLLAEPRFVAVLERVGFPPPPPGAG
jgi:hypothetical protein